MAKQGTLGQNKVHHPALLPFFQSFLMDDGISGTLRSNPIEDAPEHRAPNPEDQPLGEGLV